MSDSPRLDSVETPTPPPRCANCGHADTDHQACGHGRSTCLRGWESPATGCPCELFVASALPSETPEPTPDRATLQTLLRSFARDEANEATRWGGGFDEQKESEAKETAASLRWLADALPSLIAAKQERDLLARAINEDESTCPPGCDSFGHADDCRSGAASVIIASQQSRIVLLEQQLAADRSQLRTAIEALPRFGWNEDSVEQRKFGKYVARDAVLSLMEPGQ